MKWANGASIIRLLTVKPRCSTYQRAIFKGSLAFNALTRGAPSDEADLMSYLLFDGEYAAELIDLGYRDAEAMEPELFRFFSS